MIDKKFENLHEQWYAIKFRIKFKKIVTEMNEMLDATYNQSAMSQVKVYHS